MSKSIVRASPQLSGSCCWFTDTFYGSFSQLLWFVCHQLLLFSQPIESLLVAGGFQTLDFSMSFVFAIALIDFLVSFSIQIACFSLKLRSLVFILVFVCHHQMQDSEYRSKGYNWYDTLPAFNTWIINATGHRWSLRKTCEASVRILLLTSDRGMNSKSAEFLSW